MQTRRFPGDFHGVKSLVCFVGGSKETSKWEEKNRFVPRERTATIVRHKQMKHHPSYPAIPIRRSELPIF